MNYDDIISLAMTFEQLAKKAQVPGVTMTQMDTAIPQALTGIDGNSQVFFNVLDKADAIGIPYSQHSVGFKVGPNNVIDFIVSPNNPKFAVLLKQIMGPVMKGALDKAKLNAAGYVQNNWINDIPG